MGAGACQVADCLLLEASGDGRKQELVVQGGARLLLCLLAAEHARQGAGAFGEAWVAQVGACLSVPDSWHTLVFRSFFCRLGQPLSCCGVFFSWWKSMEQRGTGGWLAGLHSCASAWTSIVRPTRWACQRDPRCSVVLHATIAGFYELFLCTTKPTGTSPGFWNVP